MGWDAVIVGSGFGGAVTAARLAERGMRVLVLERGPFWGPGGRDRSPRERRDFPRGLWGARRTLRSVRWARRGRSATVLVRSDGLWEVHRFDHLVTLTASGVGGGSLVYTNMQVRPEADYFRALPPEITEEAMAPYYARVHAMLLPSRVPAAHPLARERAFREAASAAGLGPVHHPELAIAFGDDPAVPRTLINAAGVEQTTCTYRGECILGCAQGSKTTLDLTYVPLALRSGAALRVLSEVVEVDPRHGRWSVRYVDHEQGAIAEVTGDRLYLCAGTLQTVRLLFGLGRRCSMPAALGHRFSVNGDHGSFLRGLPRRSSSADGPSVGAFVRIPAEGALEAVLAEVGIPESASLPAPLRRTVRGSAALIAMGRDGARGTLTFSEDALHTSVGRRTSAALFEELDRTAAALARAYGARRLRINVPAGRGAQTIASVHPLGGAAMAVGPDAGVVDHLGRVFGHPGLYVVDGSILPDAPGIPPSMTIAALAERCADLT